MKLMIFMIFTCLVNINVSSKLTFTSLQNLLLTKKKTSKFINLIKKSKNLHKFTSTEKHKSTTNFTHQLK
ncbi:hypothetical protein ACJW30_12G016200 [Castanea mollissima]